MKKILYMCIVCLIFSGCGKEKPLETPDAAIQVIEPVIVKEDSLYDYTEESKDEVDDKKKFTEELEMIADNTIVDETNSFSKEELNEFCSDISSLLLKVSSTIFTINETTKDYTDKIKTFYGQSDAFKTSDIRNTEMIYSTLKEQETLSSVTGFTVKSLTMNPDTELPCAKVIGYITVHMTNTTIKDKDCYIACSFEVQKEDGTWKILNMEIPSVYDAAEDFIVCYRKGTSGKLIDMIGKKIYVYDF